MAFTQQFMLAFIVAGFAIFALVLFYGWVATKGWAPMKPPAPKPQDAPEPSAARSGVLTVRSRRAPRP